MRETLKRLARFSAGYSLSALIGPLFTLILTPLYTRVLDPSDYGVVDVMLTLSALLVSLASTGMDQALSAHFFDQPAEGTIDAWQRNLSATAFAIVAALAVIAALGLAAFATPVAAQLFHDLARRVTVLMVAVVVLCMPIYNLCLTALRLSMRIARANAVSLTYLFTLVGAAAFLVLGLQLRATGIIAANAIACASAAVVGLVAVAGPLRGRPSPLLARSLLGVGIGLLPGALGVMLFNSIDRPLLTQFVSAADVGLYAIANKLASMAFVVMGPVWVAWWPLALEMAGRQDAPRQFSRIFEYFISAGFMLALGIGLFSPEVLRIFTRDAYVPAAPYALALLAYNGPIGFAFNFLNVGLIARKRTGMLSAVFLVSAATNVALNLVLMPLIGVWGAVAATLAAGLLQTVVLYGFAQSVYPLQLRWPRVLVLFGGYFAIVGVFLMTVTEATLAARVLATLAMLALILATGVITPRQMRDAGHALAGLARRSLGAVRGGRG